MPTSIHIVCGDENDVVDVLEEDTQILLDKSDYFRVMFEDGTSEAQQSIIHKPNWKKIVTEHVIRLICSVSFVHRCNPQKQIMKRHKNRNYVVIHIQSKHLYSGITWMFLG